MPKTLMQNVVQQLERERIRLQPELHKVSAALVVGRTYLDGAKPGRIGVKRRTLSAAGRSRIAAAQRANKPGESEAANTVTGRLKSAMLLDLLVFTNQNEARDNVGVTPAWTIESE